MTGQFHDFFNCFRYLMELLDEELSAPATSLYPHNLAGILETAIRATNAQFEDQEILDRLDVRLLDVQPGDYGWDVFSLDYKVTGPISAVFGRRTLTRYLMLFNSLWRAKRMEWILSRLWYVLITCFHESPQKRYLFFSKAMYFIALVFS